MRLFGTVTGSIDRFDRAEWLTPIFDKAFGAPVVLDFPTIAATVYGPNASATVYGPNPVAMLEANR